MSDSNRLTRWLLVIGMVALAILVLYPPSEKLKGGIDLVGGTSMLFEIDTTGLDQDAQRNLSERVMNILRERVDPKGQLNLEWRPVGNTRLEIRMPRPPKEALERRVVYNEAIALLGSKNLKRYDVETALNLSAGQRGGGMQALIRGVAERGAQIAALTSAYDEYTAAQGGDDPGATQAAADKYESAMGELLATNLPIQRFEDIVGLSAGPKRTEELDRLRAEYPSFDAGAESDADGKLLTRATKAYDKWAKNKADLEDPSDLKRLLRGAGVLEFRILAERDRNSPLNTMAPVEPISKYVERLGKFGPHTKAGDRYMWLRVEDVVNFMRLDSIDDFEIQKQSPVQPVVEEYAGRYYVLTHDDPDKKMLKGVGRRPWSLREAYPDRDYSSGRPIVSFRLDSRGGGLFGELTGNNVDRPLCIVLDRAAMSYANINERIGERGQISGQFTAEKVQRLVRTLEAGSLPARLKETPLMENTIGPSLGETNRAKGIRGAVYGLIAVLVFMVLYYGVVAGGMADIALVLNMLFVLAVMAMLQATFTLPGIAGLILTIGMAVDANVLIFERVREERDRGMVFRRALNAGYDKALSTIIDANITTLIICIILGTVGSEEVKGFAYTLGIGICTSMFTALFVTRLVFNTLISAGWLSDFSMRRIIGVPTVNWVELRRIFWPVSLVVVIAGAAMFMGMSTYRTEQMFDIEFLGGSSLQIDLKPGVDRTDEQIDALITGNGEGRESAAGWLTLAADWLESAKVDHGEAVGQFTMTSPDLTSDQIGVLMRGQIEDQVERGGIRGSGHTAIFDCKPGALTMESFRQEVARAAAYARGASLQMQGARVQSVGEGDVAQGLSYEIVTIETDRELVQAAVLAVLADDLSVQRSLTFTTMTDEELTREPFFIVETEDHYLSDVVGGDANFDVRRFRGGVAVEVNLDPREPALTVAGFDKRLREVGLQPEFEQYRVRETAIYPLGPASTLAGGEVGHHRFAVLAGDEALRYDVDPDHWIDGLARPHLAAVEAALGQEKSLSKVVQFAPQIAGQTRNKATFAIVLSLFAIVAYLWLRFGTKEFGLAAIVALVHDVTITLGLVGLSQVVYNNVIARALLLEPFRIDLPMIAAILTVIGYSLNDTIVVFDRIRENKGRINALNPNIINQSINQCMSRTILTSLTTFMVVFILYAVGGKGVHGFAFALMIGVIVGTYSSVGVAAPLLCRPRLLHGIIVVISALMAMGLVYELTPKYPEARWILIGLTALAGAGALVRINREQGVPAGRPVAA